MKHIAIALVLSAAALAANSARADSRVSIGISVGTPVYRSAPVYSPAPPVVYAPAPVVVVPARSHGYWKDVQVKTWVPERWVLRTNRWGRTERVREAGYFTYVTNRVWVDGRDHRGHDRRDSYSYGYNNRDHDNRGYDNRGYDSRGSWNR
jgi:hypothetical protein